MLEQVSFQMGESTRIHGIAHCNRVLRFALMIAEAKGLPSEQKETLATAMVFHDSRRCADGYDVGHGSRAADYYRDFCDFTGMLFDPLAAEIMARHDRDTAEVNS